MTKAILFNTDMTRAILDGRKTVTRRVMKQQPADTDDCQHEMQTYDKMLPQFYKGDCSCVCRKCGYGTLPNGESIFQPPYHPGDILYVRETWTQDGDVYRYKAGFYDQSRKWRPSIHMPREAARIFLRVTDVRVERLQKIDGHGVLAEGVDNGHSNPAMGKRWENMQRVAFSALWASTIKPADRDLYGWAANPWVWVITFERISREEAGL